MTALEWRSSTALARGQAAALIVQEGQSAEHLARAAALAEDALRTEPVNVPAVRALAVVATLRRQPEKADRLLAYSESLSRRDLPTQLLLIERSVARNDIPGALRHYDRALRTTPRSADLLMPILVRAADERAIGPHLAELMGRRPPWWPRLLDRLNSGSRSSANLALIVNRLRLDLSNDIERQLFSNTITRVSQLGDYTRAISLYRRVDPRGSRLLIRDGGFESSTMPPFGWVLVDEPGLAAVRQAHQGGQALFFLTEAGRAGEVARQMLVLSPGPYSLDLRVGGVAVDIASRPVVALVCAGIRGRTLLEARLPPAPVDGITFAQDFTVPSNCPAQYMLIRAAAPLDGSSDTPWLDNIRLRRRG